MPTQPLPSSITAIAAALTHDDDLHYALSHARCLVWQGTVTERDDPPGFRVWQIDVVDDDAAMAFFPLKRGPGERYTEAWYHQRLPEDQQANNAVFAEAMASGSSEYSTEFRCRSSDGRLCWFEERVSIEQVGARQWRLAGVAVDITERKGREAELYAAQEALTAALAHEHRIAETLQRSLLLDVSEREFPGLSVVPLYESAWDEATVGGDFYDAFLLEGGRTALVVGDVSGKGLAAAERTAEVKFALRAFLREHGQPGSAMTRLNAFLCESQTLDERDTEGAGFVVLCLAVIDPVSKEARIAAAGAEPPLLLSVEGATARPVTQVGGPPLGLLTGELYDELALPLSPRDTLVMVTDGITEARRRAVPPGTVRGGAAPEFFAYDGLTRVARQAASLRSLRQVGQTVLDAARLFAGGRLQDDACLLLARLRS
jgi:serine phosphatase RsbU (regulator of sigma subunit)